jgi:type I restriction-modification system DNA methylase subunit
MVKSILDCTEQEILDYLENGMEIIDENKNKYGEVFTPLSLINEILDELPNSIWRNSNVKWLDPAAGIGHFAALVYLRLLKSLVHVIPNERQRKHHILENMLYMVEINIITIQYNVIKKYI